MTRFPARFWLIVAALTFAGTVAIPAVYAADKAGAEKTDAKKKQDAEDLRKYDKNRNGKLDPDELAELKADQQKARRKKG